MAVNPFDLARQLGGVIVDTDEDQKAQDPFDLARQLGGVIEEPAAPTVEAQPETPQRGTRELPSVGLGPLSLFRESLKPITQSDPIAMALARGAELTGSAIETAARAGESVGDVIAQAAPILDTRLMIDRQGVRLERPTPEQISSQNQLQYMQDWADSFRNWGREINQEPGTKLADLADNPARVVPFVIERVIASSPDMAAATMALPAYIPTRANEILNQRLKNDKRSLSEATVGDVAAATGAAFVEGTLERFATSRLGGIGGTGIARVGKEAALQAGTEAVQEVGALAGETAGTVRGFKPEEAGAVALEAAIVGGGLGGAIGAAAQVEENAIRRDIESRVRDIEGIGSAEERQRIQELRDKALESATAISAPEPTQVNVEEGQTEPTPLQFGEAYANRVFDSVGQYIPANAEFKVEEKVVDGITQYVVTDQDNRQYGQNLQNKDQADSFALSLNNTGKARAEVLKQLEPLSESLTSTLKGYGLNDIGLTLNNRIFTRRGEALTSEGLFDPVVRRVFLAVDAIDPQGNLDTDQRREALRGVLRHEVVHALRYLDLWKKSEWKNLEKTVSSLQKPGTNKTYLEIAKEGYGDQTPIIQVEEAVADLIRDVAGRQSTIAGKPRSLSERAINFFDRAKNALTGSGFQTYEDIVSRFERGEIGARERGRIRTFRASEEQAAQKGFVPERLQRILKTPEGRNQFRRDTLQNLVGSLPQQIFTAPAMNSLNNAGIRESRSTIEQVPLNIKVDDQEVPTRDSEGRLIYSGYEGPEMFGIQTRPTQEGLQNFWRWFGNSKATDSKKRPLVFYHGTAADITAFRPKQAGSVFVTRNPQFAEEFGFLSDNYMVSNFPDFMSDPQVLEVLDEALANPASFSPKLYDQVATAREQAVSDVRQNKAIRPAALKVIKDIAAQGRSSRYLNAIQKRLPSSANMMPVYVKAEKPWDYQNRDDVKAVIRRARENGADITASMAEEIGQGNWQTIEGSEGNAPILDAIRELGYDSMYVEEQGEKNLAVFDPGQVKSAVGNNGDFSPLTPSVRESRVRNPQINTPEFKRFFKGSKAVDETGEPQVFYHGATRDIDIFKPKPGSKLIFTSPDPNFASRYAANNMLFIPPPRDMQNADWAERQIANAQFGDQTRAPTVYPLYVSAKNPFDFQNKSHIAQLEKDLPKILSRSTPSRGPYTKAEIRKTIDEIKKGRWGYIEDVAENTDFFEKSGYDSIYVEEAGVRNLAVFSPNQLKSAVGNVGAFDITMPSIRESRRSGSEAFENKLIEDMRVPDFKSKEKLIEMNIDDFLNLAKQGYMPAKAKDISDLAKEGKKFTSLPFLQVSLNNEGVLKVVGHEGRHRARFLRDTGYQSIPVVLKTLDPNSIRWSEQDNPRSFDYVDNWPTRIEAQEGSFSIPMPVSRDQSMVPYGTKGIRESRVKPQQILFEVAPDPNNQPLTEAWRSLDPALRLTVSNRVAQDIVPKVLEASDARGRVVSQVGSYLDDTNPSFALMLEGGDPLDVAKSIGFALSQDSMMVVAPKAFKGGDVVQSVTVNLGEKTPQEIASIYNSLREIEVEGNKPVGGQTFANGFMTILNYSDVATDTLAGLIDRKLNNEYNVLVRDVYSAFPEKKDYDYASPENDGSGSRADLRKRLRDIRAEATNSVQGELQRLGAEGRAATTEAAAVTPRAREARRRGQVPLGPEQPGPSVDTSDTGAAEALNMGEPTDTLGIPTGPQLTDTMPDGTVDISRARLEPRMRRLIRGVEFIQSAPDKLRGGVGLGDIAARIEGYYDTYRSRLGLVNDIIRDAYNNIGLRNRTSAIETFERFIRARENGRVDEAAQIRAEASDRDVQLINAWEEIARLTGQINLNVRTPEGKPMRVYDAKVGGWRPIRAVPEFFPRTLRKEVMEVMSNPDSDPELYAQLLDALIDAGIASNRNDADKFLYREWFSDEIKNDYFAGVEKARSNPLPEMFYDYSWDAATRYLRKWATRTSQIEYFGQALGNISKDWFDTNIPRVRDPETQKYLNDIKNRIYEIESFGFLSNIASWLNALATATQLGNPVSASLNFLGGTLTNVQEFGIKEISKSYLDLVREWKNVQKEGTTLGILNNDVMNILNDHVERDAGKYFSAEQKVSAGLAKFANVMLTVGGFNGAENIVRASALLAARSRLNGFLRDVNDGRNNQSVKDFYTWLAKENLNADELILENGAGKATERYLRRAVNVPQGSYSIDMTPVFVDTPAGRFLLKYQKFSTQINRFFYRHFLKKFMDEPTPRNFFRILTFVGSAVVYGGAILALREALGYGDPGPDDEELKKALENEDTARAWGLIFSRAWQNIMAAGSLGFYGNYIQFAKDWQDQLRVKNPLSPPGLASIDAVADAIFRVVDQKGITARDIDEIAETSVSFYRAYKRIGLAGMDAIGVDAREVRRFAAQRDLREIREYSRRYSEEMEIEFKRRTSPGAPIRTPMTPFNKGITDALHQGDSARARLLMNQALKGQPPKERERMKQSIRASIRNRQPIQIGDSVPNKRERQEFLRWARQNLPAEAYQKIVTADRRYRRSAARMGMSIGD